MKKTIAIAILVGWLGSCQGTTPPAAERVDEGADCPPPPASPPAITVTYEGDFYNSLQSRKAFADADTITFQSARYDFIFCRGNQTWSVQPGTLKPEAEGPQDYEAEMAKLANPPYQTVKLEGKTYQYRVLLDPNPFPNWQVEPEPQRVVWELVGPDRQQPQRQVLYTLEQVQKKGTGLQLGVPQVTGAIARQGQLFWSISPEQGEGNGGIATIVSYTPKTGQFYLLQPQEIEGQQIAAATVTGSGADLTFWLATKRSGEGNLFLPGLGLVAYRPASGTVKSYYLRNSPLVGAIPNQLLPDGEWLWVGTGNGFCQLKWREAENAKAWSCWRFALMAQLPSQGVSLYPSLFAREAAGQLLPEGNGTVEVLWWSPTSNTPRRGRYEVRYAPGFSLKLGEGWTSWSEPDPLLFAAKPWDAPISWVGEDWYWLGDRFVRPFDGVFLNEVGGGPAGIGSGPLREGTGREVKAMRGDLHLLELSRTATEVKYDSAWVEDNLLQPYLTVVPHQLPKTNQPNPLKTMN